MNMHLTQTTSLSPQRVFQFSYLRSQTGIFVPHLLKFGPLLQNIIVASSITKAVQIIGAKLPLQQLPLLPESEKLSPGKISSEHSTEMSKQESKVCEVENDKYCIPQDIIATETRRKAEEILTQNVTTYTSEQQLGNYLKVQHQKQTSFQLIHFLRTSRNMEQSSFAGSEERAFVLMQQLKSKTETNMDQEFIQLHSTHKKQFISEMNNSVPIFNVKKRSAGSVTYSCMIATITELWDVGDISTEVKNSLQDSIADEMASKQMKHQCALEGGINRSMDGQEAALRIPEFQIKKFEEMPVVVTHVVSPGNFYIQHKDNNLQKLSDIMAKKNSRSYAEINCIPDIGAYVMGWSAEQELWCRAQVTKICGMKSENHHLCSRFEGIRNIEVEIRRIDYGDSTCLSLGNIKELCGEIAKIPAQALQVSLADVKPVNGESWSTEAVRWFKDKVNKRTLYARLYPEGSRVIVELFMEKGKIGAMRRSSCLSLRLAQNGHARPDRMSSMHLKRSYAHVQSRKHSEWEKYLISCYTQNRKSHILQYKEDS
ncbi:tudor domain-containing protein 5 [Pangasianodon hypophthalmus]|nr:tudor domain-containing protein 5 [Pangasianodon hypophthalmus]